MASASANPIQIPLRQFAGGFELSLRRFTTWKNLQIMSFLAIIPIAVSIFILFFGKIPQDSINNIHGIFEQILRIVYLHFLVFFVAFTFGFSVMRQDRDDQTLHYVLLQPIPRWILIAARFLAYLVLISFTTVASMWVSYILLGAGRFGFEALIRDLFIEGRFLILVKESGVIMLGLLSYGALALLMGSIFNTQFFALLLFGWETLLPYVPSALKLFSVSHYLQSLLPDRLVQNQKFIELLGEPTGSLPALGVLFGFSAMLFLVSVMIFQQRECLYGSDA